MIKHTYRFTDWTSKLPKIRADGYDLMWTSYFFPFIHLICVFTYKYRILASQKDLLWILLNFSPYHTLSMLSSYILSLLPIIRTHKISFHSECRIKNGQWAWALSWTFNFNDAEHGIINERYRLFITIYRFHENSIFRWRSSNCQNKVKKMLINICAFYCGVTLAVPLTIAICLDRMEYVEKYICNTFLSF